tara:strand:- start:19 stop:648 length:630 start_codon:yes stop_codon:yes gene_type:complete
LIYFLFIIIYYFVGGGYSAQHVDPNSSASQISKLRKKQDQVIKNAGKLAASTNGVFDSTTTNKGKRKTKSSPSTKNTSSSSSSASASSSSSSSLNGSSYGVDFSSYDVTGAEEDPGRLTVANVPINPQRPFQCPECKKCYPHSQGLYQHRFKIHGFRARRDRAPGERGPSEEVLAKANGVLANNVSLVPVYESGKGGGGEGPPLKKSKQ